MHTDLTTSLIARENILNNPFALTKLEKNLALSGIIFEGETVFTKQQVAQILEIDERTVDRYITTYGDELRKNGYQIIRGKSLKNIKIIYVDDTNVVDIAPKTQIGRAHV